MEVDKFKLVLDDLKKRKIPTEVKRVVTAMLDKKTEKIVVLKLKEVNAFTDYMVIGTGNSQRQNSAISDEVQKIQKNQFKSKPFSIEGARQGDWILLDYFNFVVHIFSPEWREKYALEKLWMDAKRYEFFLPEES